VPDLHYKNVVQDKMCVLEFRGEAIYKHKQTPMKRRICNARILHARNRSCPTIISAEILQPIFLHLRHWTFPAGLIRWYGWMPQA